MPTKSPKESLDIAIVIPCWIVTEELLDLTKRAVASFGEVPLVVVDNGSPIGGGYLRSVATTYVRNRENLGYAKAVNQGLQLTKAPLVAVANNDIRVSPNWQEVTREAWEEHPGIGTLHFRMTDYDTPMTYGDRLILTGKERWCTGSFFVLDRRLGITFDEDFFNSYDDWALQMEVRKEGFHTAYTDQACYQHRFSTTQKQIPEREENNKRNAEVFKAKWGRYAEEIFEEQFPEQMAQDYWEGFST